MLLERKKEISLFFYENREDDWAFKNTCLLKKWGGGVTWKKTLRIFPLKKVGPYKI
jgi:hypothetical protein